MTRVVDRFLVVLLLPVSDLVVVVRVLGKTCNCLTVVCRGTLLSVVSVREDVPSPRRRFFQCSTEFSRTVLVGILRVSGGNRDSELWNGAGLKYFVGLAGLGVTRSDRTGSVVNGDIRRTGWEEYFVDAEGGRGTDLVGDGRSTGEPGG